MSEAIPAKVESGDPASPESQGVDADVAAGKLKADDWATYRRLLRYVKPHWFMFLLAVVGLSLIHI